MCDKLLSFFFRTEQVYSVDTVVSGRTEDIPRFKDTGQLLVVGHPSFLHLVNLLVGTMHGQAILEGLTMDIQKVSPLSFAQYNPSQVIAQVQVDIGKSTGRRIEFGVQSENDDDGDDDDDDTV